MRIHHKIIRLSLTGLLLFFIGCGDSQPETAPAGGVVTFNGEPLANASVNFYPENGKSANGVTDDDGKFTLTTFKSNDGAIVGNHTATVTIISSEEVPESIPEDYDYGAAGSSEEEDGIEIPAKYLSAETSPLKFEVKAGEKNQFELKIE